MSVNVQKSYIGTCIAAANSLGQIQARVSTPIWNKRVHKFFNAPFNITAHDLAASVHIGDKVRIDLCRYKQHSTAHRREVVAIISPYHTPLSERENAAVPSPSSRLTQWLETDQSKFQLKEAAVRRHRDEVSQLVGARNDRLSPLVSIRYNKSQQMVNDRKDALTRELQDRLNRVQVTLQQRSS